jgi:hypothetical protein
VVHSSCELFWILQAGELLGKSQAVSKTPDGAPRAPRVPPSTSMSELGFSSIASGATLFGDGEPMVCSRILLRLRPSGDASDSLTRGSSFSSSSTPRLFSGMAVSMLLLLPHSPPQRVQTAQQLRVTAATMPPSATYRYTADAPEKSNACVANPMGDP